MKSEITTDNIKLENKNNDKSKIDVDKKSRSVSCITIGYNSKRQKPKHPKPLAPSEQLKQKLLLNNYIEGTNQESKQRYLAQLRAIVQVTTLSDDGFSIFAEKLADKGSGAREDTLKPLLLAGSSEFVL